MKCTYCGDPHGEDLDHVVPQADSNWQTYDKKYVVPACKECNRTLGAKPFYTISERAAYLSGVYSNKYKAFLRAPNWEPDEIAELDGRMRHIVQNQQDGKDEITKRLEHLDYIRITGPTIKEVWQAIKDSSL